MAKIIRNPNVEDYFVERTLADAKAGPNGFIPDYEANRLIVLKDYRVPLDFEAFAAMSTNTESADKAMQRVLKKVVSTHIMEATPESTLPVHQAVFKVFCKSDPELLRRAQAAMKVAHDAAISIFKTCFPTYEYFKLIPSVRLTQTMFENMHWDNHNIPEDFQQVRIFVNLDQRPRVWNVSHNFVEYARSIYRERHLERFAGRDPNDLNDYVCGEVLGGSAGACLDTLPRHVVGFDPGEVWMGESRMLAHQIFYGERAMVYMFFVKPEKMLNPQRRFNAQVEALHREMAAAEPAIAA
ncbi:MAG: hypothetical protein IT548_13910 [Alphaproteobacteria bacterium]|nr:hypothetical protein [Alphaproteobacteria bacterium]